MLDGMIRFAAVVAQRHPPTTPEFGPFALIVLAVLTPYFLLIQVRRLRYRRLAGRLSAQYVSQGLFRAGRIIGTSGGQEFTVETFVRGRPAHFYTSVSMACDTTRMDRAIPVVSSGVHISLRNTATPLSQSHDPQLTKLLAGIGPDVASLRKGDFDIKAGRVRWVTGGILADDREILMIVPQLQRIARAVESLPSDQGLPT